MSKDSRLVVKDNSLIDASFNLSLVEQRIMLMAIVEARELPSLTFDTPVKVSVKSYIDAYKVVGNNAYKQVQDAVDTLFERQFSYYDPTMDERFKERWIYKASYIDDKGHIVLFFTPTVISMISRLYANFTQYLLEEVSEFKSKYSIRLYELIAKYKGVGASKKYGIDELRSLLGVENTEYKTMSLFKVNVLDKAVKEIKDKSNHIDVSYIQLKEGRNIVGFIFKVKEKGNINKPIDIGFKGMSMPQAVMFSDKLSRDTAFQNHYKAHVGESTEDYADRIAVLLSQEFYVKEWMPYLKAVGYVLSNK